MELDEVMALVAKQNREIASLRLQCVQMCGRIDELEKGENEDA